MAPKPIVVPPLAKQYVERGSWSNETFFTLLERQAARFASREAFADARGRISYGELRERIERCAAFLRRAGIGRGDVVTVQLPNRIDFPVVFFALELIGAVANKVNPDFRVRELEYIVNFSGSRGYVFPREFKGFDYGEMARGLQEKCKGLAHLFSDEDINAGIIDVNLGGEFVYPVADVLAARKIPFVFITGYGVESIDSRFEYVPIVKKPVQRQVLQKIFVPADAAEPAKLPKRRYAAERVPRAASVGQS